MNTQHNRAEKKRGAKTRGEHRYSISPFLNRATGSTSWRVSGYSLTGERIRENYSSHARAKSRFMELELEAMHRTPEPADLKATTLSKEQLAMAEAMFLRLDIAEVLPAVEHWIRTARGQIVLESPSIDAAVAEFREYLGTTDLRELSMKSIRSYLKRFGDGVPNMRVCDFGRVQADEYLGKLVMGAVSKDTTRRRISRFFSWCMTRGYAKANPFARIGKARRRDDSTPAILSVGESERLLRASERHHGGNTVAYHALALFAGIRPWELSRMSWQHVNLTDREIRLPGEITKTRRARTIQICDTLHAWLVGREGVAICPKNINRHLCRVRALAGFGPEKPWVSDVMRHTSVSHFFRLTGSYGLTAERHGNSEGVIRQFYQGLVSSADTTRFYALRPTPK